MKRSIKAGDIVIISGVLLLALAVFLLFLIPSLAEDAVTLEISCNNETELYTLNEDRELVFKSGGYTLKISVKDKKVWVRESDCPDNTCVHTGKIDRSGQMIACVPAGITLRITGEEAEYDFVAG